MLELLCEIASKKQRKISAGGEGRMTDWFNYHLQWVLHDMTIKKMDSLEIFAFEQFKNNHKCKGFWHSMLQNTSDVKMWGINRVGGIGNVYIAKCHTCGETFNIANTKKW